MPATTPLINGVNYAWANIKFVPFGVPMSGITSISYKRRKKKDNNYGYGDQPISRGYGNYEYEAEIEVYQDEWKKIIAAAPSRDPLLIAPFDIPVLYGSSAINFTSDKLRAVEFLDDPFNSKQGDTKMVITIPLIIAAIDR